MNLYQNLVTTTERNPDATALYFGHETISYGELLSRVNRLANALRELGIDENSKVAVLLRNVPEFVVSYYAVLGLGAVVVPLCYMCLAEEVEKIVCDSAVETLITNFEFDDMVRELQNSMCSQISRIIVSEAPELEGVIQFEKLLEGRSEDLKPVERSADDVAAILYAPTSSKVVRGCMLTHGNLDWNAEAVQKMDVLTSEDVVMGVLPFFAAYGQSCVMNASIKAGCSIVLHESFIPGEVLKSLQHEQVTVFFGVPTMYVYILNHPLIYQYDLGSVRLWVCGGAPFPREVMERWNNELGARIYEGYGLTEAAPVVTMQPLDGPYKIGSIGVPVEGVEVKVVDEEGRELSRGEVGELIVRGPNVMKGYYNKPEETEKVLRDGWLHTGDMVYMDNDGYLFIVGRKKDLIIRGGFNIYPREIEEVLVSHPLISEAAVVGVPNKYLGEEVKAYVKQKPGSNLTEEQVLEYCEERLPYYKTPKFVVFVKSFKKDPSGQILKDLIEDESQ
ncbi:MAG: long-chain fatty acid--CoA ligase [Actinobacteria bacterium]|nr:long-chain fatty acid--CoA ligase [Actinomycetota bacterium]